LAEHGGKDGVRDETLIESALAACYAYGIAKKQGFMDGKRRTAWVLERLFLVDNDVQLKFEAIQTMESVAGAMDEEAMDCCIVDDDGT